MNRIERAREVIDQICRENVRYTDELLRQTKYDIVEKTEETYFKTRICDFTVSLDADDELTGVEEELVDMFYPDGADKVYVGILDKLWEYYLWFDDVALRTDDGVRRFIDDIFYNFYEK